MWIDFNVNNLEPGRLYIGKFNGAFDMEEQSFLAVEFEIVSQPSAKPLSGFYYNRDGIQSALSQFRRFYQKDFLESDDLIGTYWWVIRRPDKPFLWVLGYVPDWYLEQHGFSNGSGWF